jgi:hypothetical protein
MDKMLYYKKVEGDTRVAFKSINKFVKLSKIEAILEEENKKS